jgi:rSAM/selenodomain-associated transferase 1
VSGATSLVILAKAPVAGLAKTRLAPALGAAGAAALAARMLDWTVSQALAAGLGDVELSCAPDRHHPAFAPFSSRPGLRLTDQVDADLGSRMSAVFERVLPSGTGVLLTGTDAPALDASRFASAARALAAADAVFVPAHDGGYALVGLSRPAPALFDDMPWSTPQVMARTRERLQALGLRWIELEPVADVDEPADLVHVPAHWLGA